MGKATEAPINPRVLDWAVSQSGLFLPEIADAAEVDLGDPQAWLRNEQKPGVAAVPPTESS